MASATTIPIVEDGGIKLRSYQHEMLDASKKGNIIVAMDTGSGKTHVAVARIRWELEKTDSPKVGVDSLSTFARSPRLAPYTDQMT